MAPRPRLQLPLLLLPSGTQFRWQKIASTCEDAELVPVYFYCTVLSLVVTHTRTRTCKYMFIYVICCMLYVWLVLAIIFNSSTEAQARPTPRMFEEFRCLSYVMLMVSLYFTLQFMLHGLAAVADR